MDHAEPTSIGGDYWIAGDAGRRALKVDRTSAGLRNTCVPGNLTATTGALGVGPLLRDVGWTGVIGSRLPERTFPDGRTSQGGCYDSRSPRD